MSNPQEYQQKKPGVPEAKGNDLQKPGAEQNKKALSAGKDEDKPEDQDKRPE